MNSELNRNCSSQLKKFSIQKKKMYELFIVKIVELFVVRLSTKPTTRIFNFLTNKYKFRFVYILLHT